MPESKEEVDLAEVVNRQSAKIAELERELHSYRHIAHPNNDTALRWRNAYLEGKLRRQAVAIQGMQKVGWQPTRIIREVPYPDDQHLWDELPVQSVRRTKRRPSILIKEE